MDNAAVWIIGIIIGVPVVCGIGYAAFEHVLNTKVKLRELAVRELEAKAADRARSDELNAKILRMDDLGISPTDISSLTEEVRQLRDEIARMKQDADTRTLG